MNPIERIKLCVSKIKDPEVNDQQKKEFLDELCHWAEELDLAKDFFTIGGLDILAPLLDHSDDEVRIQTCALLAVLVQNNDHCQRIIVQSGLQQKLLKIVEDSTNPDLTIKAVTAISGKRQFENRKEENLLRSSIDSRLYSWTIAITKISRFKSVDSSIGIANSTSTNEIMFSYQYHLLNQCTDEK